MSEQTATERLRELLDEREVEWWNDTDPEPQRQTNVWAGGQLVTFHENANGTVGYVVYSTHDLTPEQAIAATLGNDGPERSKNGVERSSDGADTCVPDDYTAKLMAEVERLQGENARLWEQLAEWERLAAGIDLPEYPVTQFKPKDLERENASLRDRITTQKQTIQAYRDESREWREEAERVQAENAKLRELVLDAWGDGHPDRSCDGCDIRDECHDDLERMRKDGAWRFTRCLFELRIEERMRELGIEVDA